MRCDNLDACRTEIRTYCNYEPSGFPLLVDVECYDHFQQILQDFQADPSKKVLLMSDFCSAKGLPVVQDAYQEMFSSGSYAVVGISQACMLQGSRELHEEIDRLCNHSAAGHTVILLEHCRDYLEVKLQSDPRLKNRILLLDDDISPLPKISISNRAGNYDAGNVQGNIKQLLAYLEKLTDSAVKQQGEIEVSTTFSAYTFKKANYAVYSGLSDYEKLCQKFLEIAEYTVESDGTKDEWAWLFEQVVDQTNINAFFEAQFGTCTHLEHWISKWMAVKDKYISWLYWLALKICPPSDPYLFFAVQRSDSSTDLERTLYFALLDKVQTDDDFLELYRARREILRCFSENNKWALQYANETGRYDDAAVYYLTDQTGPERIKLLQCLERYQYSEEQIKSILATVSPDLSLYLQSYTFTDMNTKLPNENAAFLNVLTQYFNEYKIQKVQNRILPEFMEQVGTFAKERPYTKLLSRMAILKHLDCRDAQAYFFDAFGVEYLAYLVKRCEEYGLLAEIHIGRAELPTITSMNKEFESYFKYEVRKIDKLDEYKHHSAVYDYQKRKEPIHLFAELKLIDTVLKDIQNTLVLDGLDKVVIVSDHGASRLAVIHESDIEPISMEEKGQHSGRCCHADEDPGLPFAAYEQGYSVLANYDRFRGGRKADVEVHGGASMEEVLVPVILLSVKPDNISYAFVNTVIYFKVGQVVKLTLFCNIPMKKPRILIKDEFYDGVFTADAQHAEFALNNIRRKGKYEAEIYEGDVSQGVILPFEIRKQTHEVDFGI